MQGAVLTSSIAPQYTYSYWEDENLHTNTTTACL